MVSAAAQSETLFVFWFQQENLQVMDIYRPFFFLLFNFIEFFQFLSSFPEINSKLE